MSEPSSNKHKITILLISSHLPPTVDTMGGTTSTICLLAVLLCHRPALCADAADLSGSCTRGGDCSAVSNPLLEIPGGTFTMGTDRPHFPQDGEGPARQVTVSPFLIQRREVSNAEFARFVADTGYVTEVRRWERRF